MKKLFLNLFLFASLITNAQNKSGFKVGVNLYPHQFFKINTTAVNYVRDQQQLPNGISLGVSISKEWNNKWGIQTGFDYSYQNEKTYVNTLSYSRLMNYDFTYHKIPLSVVFFHQLKSKTYLSFTQGVQFSWLKYFKGVHVNYDLITTITPSGNDMYSDIQPDLVGFFPVDNWKLHGRELFGVVGAMGIKGDLWAKTTYSANLRYEYDISSADKVAYYYAGSFKRDIKSHNLRIGIELGIQYMITVKRKLKIRTDCNTF